MCVCCVRRESDIHVCMHTPFWQGFGILQAQTKLVDALKKASLRTIQSAAQDPTASATARGTVIPTAQPETLDLPDPSDLSLRRMGGVLAQAHRHRTTTTIAVIAAGSQCHRPDALVQSRSPRVMVEANPTSSSKRGGWTQTNQAMKRRWEVALTPLRFGCATIVHLVRLASTGCVSSVTGGGHRSAFRGRPMTWASSTTKRRPRGPTTRPLGNTMEHGRS